MAAMSENAKKVLAYLKGVNGENVTVHDVSDALGLPCLLYTSDAADE